jgi:hypothetical protein
MNKLPENCLCKKCKHGLSCMLFGKTHVKKMLEENKCRCVECGLFKAGTCPLMS